MSSGAQQQRKALRKDGVDDVTKKICKLCKVMQLETTRPHSLAPLHSCASVSVGEGLCAGWGGGTSRFLQKRPAFEMTATGTSLSMSFGEMSKTKRREP